MCVCGGVDLRERREVGVVGSVRWGNSGQDILYENLPSFKNLIQYCLNENAKKRRYSEQRNAKPER